MAEVLEAGGCPKQTREGWKGEASGMVGVPHQPSFCLPQSSRGGQRAHSKSEEKPVLQPVWQQKPEDPQVSRELSTEVTEPPKAEGRGGRRAREFFSWLDGELKPQPSCPIVLLLGEGGPLLSGCQSQAISVTMAPSLPDTFFRFFRAEARPATGSHCHIPVYTPEHGRAHRRP